MTLKYAKLLSPPVVADHVGARQQSSLVPGPQLRQGYISWELKEAWDLPRPSGNIGGMAPAELQVLSWLRLHAGMMKEAERRWGIDCRAIAAAIAWEALKNPVSFNVAVDSIHLGKAAGPGKVHVDTAVVREVEAAGYLPALDPEQRRKVLATPGGAITYIGAIMHGHAQIAAKFGHMIWRRVDILTNEYQGRSLTAWEVHLADKQARGEGGRPLIGENPMSLWAQENMPYLDLAVEA